MGSDDDDSDYDMDTDPDEYDIDYESEDDHQEISKNQQKQAYELIERNLIFGLMNRTLEELNSITGISNTILRVLLNQFKWDKDRLLEKFYDGPRKLFKDANIFFTDAENVELPSDDELLCQICYDEVERQHIIGGICGHYFCKDCYKQYAQVKIQSDGESQLTCPAHQCRSFIEDEVIIQLFNDPGNPNGQMIVNQYKNLMIDSFVSQHRSMLFCSTPDCSFVMKIQSHDHNVGIEVACECGETLCSSCGSKWHDPVQCDLLKLWKKKCDDDSETYNWIHANTKECPKCKATIEKDGGCNHVICRNQSCRYEFCWVCLAAWSSHGSTFYNCNRYNEAEGADARQQQENSRAALERYLFYYNRYHNHAQSLKKEGKLQKCVQKKMKSLQEREGLDMSWVEVQFLRNAVEVLQKSRQILMFTYVFAFYLQKSNNTTIFEDNQANLEQATEKLSEYLEREMPESIEDISEIKCLVQDRARYCSDRSTKLIEHVHEGYNNDFWTYRDTTI